MGVVANYKIRSLIWSIIALIIPVILFLVLAAASSQFSDIQKMITEENKWGEAFQKYPWLIAVTIFSAGIFIIFLPLVQIMAIFWIVFLVIGICIIGYFIVMNILGIKIPILNGILFIFGFIVLLLFSAIIPAFMFKHAHTLYKKEIKTIGVEKKIKKELKEESKKDK